MTFQSPSTPKKKKNWLHCKTRNEEEETLWEEYREERREKERGGKEWEREREDKERLNSAKLITMGGGW